MTTEKFCVKCGRKFIATGREVICPACKQAAAEDAKKAAVLRAKQASWRGESVPVRISGRASTVIRAYGAANNLPFAAALDDLLKASDFFASTGKAWESVEPYKSRRLKKSTEGEQDAPHDAQEVKPQDVPQDAAQEVKKTGGEQDKAQAAKVTSKSNSKTSKTSKAGKVASKK